MCQRQSPGALTDFDVFVRGRDGSVYHKWWGGEALGGLPIPPGIRWGEKFLALLLLSRGDMGALA